MALIAFALLIAGCGGDSEGTAASGQPSVPRASKAFVKQANLVCHIGTGRRALILEEAREAGKVGSDGEETKAQRQRRADLVWTLDQTMLGELEQVKIRPGDAAALKALSVALEERIKSVKAARSVAVPSPKLDWVIDEYGIKGCSY